jgi:hypothetical protein
MASLAQVRLPCPREHTTPGNPNFSSLSSSTGLAGVSNCFGRCDRGSRRAIALPAALQPRLQPDRERLRQAQGAAAQGPGTRSEGKSLGTTLVVVYRTEDTTGSLFIYDALNNSMFAGTAQFDLLHPGLTGTGRFTMVGADGQRGLGGYDNLASNELTLL